MQGGHGKAIRDVLASRSQQFQLIGIVFGLVSNLTEMLFCHSTYENAVTVIVILSIRMVHISYKDFAKFDQIL